MTIENTNASATPAPAAGSTPPAADWTASFSDDLKGFVQTKQFKDPSAVVESYRNLEKLTGAQEKLIRLPEKEDAPEWAQVYEKLGRPKEAKEYQLEMPAEGGDKEFLEEARSKFHELGLNRKQAETLAKWWNQKAANVSAQSEEQRTAAVLADAENLKKEWGMAYDQNLGAAKNATKKFGIDEATLDKMESALGYSGLIKFMHNLGSKIGEASFISGDGKTSGFGGVMSPEQARGQLAALNQDSDFIRRYAEGGAPERQKMEELMKQAYPS